MSGNGSDGVSLLLGDQRRGIVALSIPLAVALLIQQLNGLVDSFWVSDLGGDALAAIGLVSPLYCVLVGIGNGLGIGSSAAISRAIGRGSKRDVDGLALQSLILSVIVSIPLTVLFLLSASPVMALMGARGMEDVCMDYATPLFVSSVFIILSGVLSGMFRGEGDARRSMYIQVIGAVTNIVLDPIMIFGMGMGVSGAAWATSISFMASCAVGMYWYLSGKTYADIRSTDRRPDRAPMSDILSVGLPEAIELSIMNIFNLALNYYVVFCGGTDAVAVYSTVWRVAYLLMIPGQAIGGALVSVCSAEYGMGRFDMIRDGFRYAVVLSILSVGILCLAGALMAGPIADVFTHSPDMVHMRDEMVSLIYHFAVFLPVMSLVFTGSSLLQSIRKAKGAMVNSLLRNIMLVLVFAIAAYCFGTVSSVWMAITVGEIMGGLMMGVHAVIGLGRASSDERPDIRGDGMSRRPRA